MNKNKTIIGVVIVTVLASGGGFYGGMKYAESQKPSGFATGGQRAEDGRHE